MKALSFEGSGFEYFKIWIVNVLLTIVTLGLYYPWAKVRNHRYFYANSTLEGRNFEYHATGKQLFVGYLIAMALFIAYVVIQQVSPEGSLIVLLILFLALPWIIWRSMKFNMRMSSFSNVRFGFMGKLGGSYMTFLVFPFILFLAFYGPIIALTMLPFISLMYPNMPWLAVALPIFALALFIFAFYMYALVRKKSATYIIGGSHYGQGQFVTELETKKFLMILLKTFGVSILVFASLVMAIAVVASATIGLDGLKEAMGTMKDPNVMKGGGILPIVLFAIAYLGLILAMMFIMAYSITRYRKYVYANTTLDEKITFSSTLKAMPLAWVMVSNFLAVIFTLGLALPWAKVRLTRLFLENTHVSTDIGFDEYVTQKQKEGSALGDQIGDAFDVDVGLGF